MVVAIFVLQTLYCTTYVAVFPGNNPTSANSGFLLGLAITVRGVLITVAFATVLNHFKVI
jgi:hypothetical protein